MEILSTNLECGFHIQKIYAVITKAITYLEILLTVVALFDTLMGNGHLRMDNLELEAYGIQIKNTFYLLHTLNTPKM